MLTFFVVKWTMCKYRTATCWMRCNLFWVYSLIFCKESIKIVFPNVSFNFFPFLYFLWIIYSFLFTLIYEGINFWYFSGCFLIYLFIFSIYQGFFVFYSIREICVWSVKRNLLNGTYNQTQSCYLSLIFPNLFDTFEEVSR